MNKKRELSVRLWELLLTETTVVDLFDKDRVIDQFVECIRKAEKNSIFGCALFQLDESQPKVIIQWNLSISLNQIKLFDLTWKKVDENVFHSEKVSFLNKKHQNVFFNFLRSHPNHIDCSIIETQSNQSVKRTRITTQRLQNEIVNRFLNEFKWIKHESNDEIVCLINDHLNDFQKLNYDQYLRLNEPWFDCGFLSTPKQVQDLINCAKQKMKFDGMSYTFDPLIDDDSTQCIDWDSIIFSQSFIGINDNESTIESEKGVNLKTIAKHFAKYEYQKHQTILKQFIKILSIEISDDDCFIVCEID